MTPLISVIMPVRNGSNYIKEALDSLLAQDCRLEILVVDDGSEDNTAAIASEYGCTVLSHGTSRGPVAAKNTGLQAASGEYVLFMDHDDVMRGGALKALCAAMEEDPDAAAVQAQVRDFKSPDCQDTNVLIRPEPYYGLFTGAILIRRAVFDVIGPFPTAQAAGEIIDWSSRMQENGLKIKKINLVSTNRRVHGSNFGRTRRGEEFKDFAAILRARLAGKSFIRTIFLTLTTILLTTVGATAQETPSRHAVPGQRYLKEYWGRSELYLQHQAYYMLDLADKALDANPPSLKIGREREMAFLMLDAVVHEPAPIDNPAVLEFLSGRMNKVLEDLDKPLKGRKSLRIYKLYNCGMLFRTRDLTIAVDLNGRDGKLIPDEIMKKIVGHIDALFVTHNHGDHFDSHVRDFCHKAGVPIYATDEIFKNDIQVNHVRKDDLYTFDIELPKGNITVNVLPGHQDAVQNNIWIVTLPNGKVVGATGDQWLSGGEDLKWLKDIHSRLPRIDVLAMDCWIHDFDEHVADFNPRLLVSQHENEIGAHGIDHREAYWMTIFKNTKVHQSQVPWILMAWGEWFDYK